MEILTMTEARVGEVAALEKDSFSTPWSEASIRSELDNPWALWLLAVDEGENLLGYLGVQYGPDGGDILTVATAPAARGQGVARRLILEMESRLRDKGLHYLTLEVRPSNAPALALYNRLGFRQVGLRKNYYRAPREDAILLTHDFEEEEHPC